LVLWCQKVEAVSLGLVIPHSISPGDQSNKLYLNRDGSRSSFWRGAFPKTMSGLPTYLPSETVQVISVLYLIDNFGEKFIINLRVYSRRQML